MEKKPNNLVSYLVSLANIDTGMYRVVFHVIYNFFLAAGLGSRRSLRVISEAFGFLQLPSSPGMDSVQLPDYLRQWLDSWGPQIRSSVERSLDQAGVPRGWWPTWWADATSDEVAPLRVGTDCSGVESPIHALRLLKIKHRHLFSCERAKAPRLMIAANSPPEIAFFEDIKQSQPEAVPAVDLYIAGFSCKPFSLLHHQTKLLEEKEAAIFFAVLERLKRLQPAAFVLENVEGIKRCMNEVLSLLRDVGYNVIVELLNPLALGEPVNRPRYYFIGTRKDVARTDEEQSQRLYSEVWRDMCGETEQCQLSSRLLPQDHPWVLRHQAQRRVRWEEAKKSSFQLPGQEDAKWVELHKEWMKGRELMPVEGKPGLAEFSPDIFLLHLARERDAWQSLLATGHCKKTTTCDISQSLGRMPLRCDGALPTITPGGNVLVAEVQRVLTPVEKLLVHGLPLHELHIPPGISAADMENMGGNMMHLQTVGIAMLLSLTFVNWGQAMSQPTFGPLVAVQAVQARKLKSAKEQKRLEALLKARFGMARAKPVRKARKRRSLGKACLRGTRWAS